MRDLGGGLRSGMTYLNARSLGDIRSKAKFIRVTQAGFVEGTPHGANSR